jgi:hypothetical protein
MRPKELPEEKRKAIETALLNELDRNKELPDWIQIGDITFFGKSETTVEILTAISNERIAVVKMNAKYQITELKIVE